MDVKLAKVFGSLMSDGAGGIMVVWFLDEDHADHHQKNLDEPNGESCVTIVETYQGSNVWHKAHDNESSEEWL